MILSVDWNLWGVLLFASILELIGDLAFKWWAETGRWHGLVIGLALYVVSLILFAHLRRGIIAPTSCGPCIGNCGYDVATDLVQGEAFALTMRAQVIGCDHRIKFLG
jgi:hypothetical protein